MSGALGLSLYLLGARAGEQDDSLGLPARPSGRLIWLDAASAQVGHGLATLAGALLQAGLADSVLVTCPDDLPPMPGDVLAVAPPAETRAAARAFLDHWHPDLGIVAAGGLRPALIDAAIARDLPLLLIEGRAPRVAGGRSGWYPGLLRRLLGGFSNILVLDENAQRAFRRAGAPVDRMRLAGRLEEPSRALPHTEAERAALTRAFGTRPVWLATALPVTEDALVAEAQQIASRAAHRLLLILVPDDLGRAEELATRLETDHGLIVARRGADQDVEEETQVYIADTEGEYGLWYRLAPLAYMGGTMVIRDGPTVMPRHPFEAAALGSVIIHGPITAPFAEAYDRLNHVGGCRPLIRPTDLGEAVGDLLAPDRAARIARAAWDVTTAGAEATSDVLRLVRDRLGIPVVEGRKR
ncbi:MAG: glycosyltransferase N-terminal domain-containing protein [Gemmobacter sp.]|nr:glycosyltransferase N-terminal domain-containing protein [Gemmobacter sp.]